MRRRDFITLVGGAGAVWPLIVRAKPITAPVVGCLMNQSPGETEIYLCGRLTLSVTPTGSSVYPVVVEAIRFDREGKANE